MRVLPQLAMLSVVVLLTVFLGLVGVLVLLSELQRVWQNAHDPELLWRKVQDWLEKNDLHLPTPEDVLQVFSDRLSTWTDEPGNSSDVSWYWRGSSTASQHAPSCTVYTTCAHVCRSTVTLA